MYLNVKKIDENDPIKSLPIKIWDISGAERYKALKASHIKEQIVYILFIKKFFLFI